MRRTDSGRMQKVGGVIRGNWRRFIINVGHQHTREECGRSIPERLRDVFNGAICRRLVGR